MDTVCAYHVVIRSASNRKWFIRMEEKEYELYITIDWNRIKKEMSITNDHLVVFEIVDLQTFNMTVFKCAPFFLSLSSGTLCCYERKTKS
ncbi:putative DNA-binding pseudobarrel domain superfamily [Helianthus annuus]|nr:putative DNA-binding pseudobarrel domain superfamily [Helianthus annuus]